MKRIIILTVAALLSSCASVEKKEPVYIQTVPETVVPFFELTQAPVFPGCDPQANNQQLIQCLSKKVGNHVRSEFNMNYLINQEIERHRIMASFVVLSSGNIGKVTANESNPVLLAETKRVLFSLPKMQPANKEGKNVATSFALPITLVLQ